MRYRLSDDVALQHWAVFKIGSPRLPLDEEGIK
jgi:hypothetical protein